MSEDVCEDCGCILASTRKPRSLVQHRRFFKVICEALKHWPETHADQFTSTEELRSWLLIEAKHSERGATIPLTGMSKERAMFLAEAAIRGSGRYARVTIEGDSLVITKPKSIAFHRLSHQAFCALNKDIDDIITSVIGVSGDKLLMEAKRAVQ